MKRLLAASLIALPTPALGLDRAPDYAALADAAEAGWTAWATGAEREYEVERIEGGRVLFWHTKRSKASKLERAAERTIRAFDALFPPQERTADDPPPRCAVLVELANAEDFAALAETLAQQNAALASWAPNAARGVGFALEDPLAAGWLLEVPQSEVWSPENELVNRLARLLTIERFGRQPNWLEMGLAWQFELTICKDVFCFPYRAGFVSKKEHRSWDSQLAAAMRARGDTPIGVEELAGWPRGTWDEVRGPLSWGAAAMLARHYEEELPKVLEAFAAERRKEGRRTHPDGSWETIPDYEIPTGRQTELLDSICAVDFAKELTRFAKSPRGYARSR